MLVDNLFIKIFVYQLLLNFYKKINEKRKIKRFIYRLKIKINPHVNEFIVNNLHLINVLSLSIDANFLSYPLLSQCIQTNTKQNL